MKSELGTKKPSLSCMRDEKLTGFCYPSLSYSKTLDAWFVAPDGVIRQVRSCTNAEFREFVLACTSAMQPWQRHDLLNDLEWDEEIGRWYVLDTLAQRRRPRIDVPLFNSLEEAATDT